MRILIRLLSILLLASALVSGHAATSLAWTHNEHVINNSGDTAHDVVKILDGHYNITAMAHWTFPSTGSWQVTTLGGKEVTVLRWWGATVPPGGHADCCFTALTASGNTAPQSIILAAFWTDENGLPYAPFPSPSHLMVFSPNHPSFSVELSIQNNQTSGINISSIADWETGNFQLIGEADPITVNNLRTLVVDGALDPYTLTLDNLTNNYDYPGAFQQLTDQVVLPYGQTLQLPDPPDMVTGQSLVAVADLGDGNFDLYNFEAPDETMAVPAFGPIGFIGAGGGLMVLFAMFWAASRRRSKMER